MKLKTITVKDAEGKDITVAVLDDKGLPVYVHDNGQEVGFDAPAAATKITALNREAQGHREAKEAAEGALKKFEGIEDPAKALEALQTVANLNSGELTTAAKVQEIKDEAKRAAEAQVEAATGQLKTQLTDMTAQRDTAISNLHGELIGGGFARSKFIAEKTILPSDIMQATFGKAFKVEEGKIVAYGSDQKPIYSKVRIGEIANFDEALEQLVDAYPNKATILKGAMGAGGGAGPGGGGAAGQGEMTRAEFVKLNPTAQGEVIGKGTKIID